jgi:NAD(P)-dependent dehydrogenase (short-subunit alcohol dehydrogenase family)
MLQRFWLEIRWLEYSLTDMVLQGFELVKQLLAKPEPYRFILGARDTETTKKAYDDLKFDSTTHSLTVLPLELSNLKAVKSFAQQTLKKLGRDRLDYFLLNAGLAKAATGPGPHGSKWCEAYVVNHLCEPPDHPDPEFGASDEAGADLSAAQHYLTHLFREKLVESKSRVVVVSSGAIRHVSDPSKIPQIRMHTSLKSGADHIR